MNVNMTVEKNLKGFTNIYITTPTGTKVLMKPVCKSNKTLVKLLYKLQKECEDEKSSKKQGR